MKTLSQHSCCSAEKPNPKAVLNALASFPRFFHTAPQIEQIKCREIGGNEGKQRNSHVGGQCPWWGVLK